MAEFVTIYSSIKLPEIYMLQGHLEAAGIPSFAKDEHLNQMAPYLSSLSNGIQLQVRSEDVEQSVQLLQEMGLLVPKVSKNDHFTRNVGLVFLAALICEIIYFLYKNNIL